MKDIDHFSESRMEDKCRRDFIGQLPSHIRDMVQTGGAGLAVLYDYRGPLGSVKFDIVEEDGTSRKILIPSYGVQEIQFSHAVSSMTMSDGEPIKYTEFPQKYSEWMSVYFDETSGEIISASQAKENKSNNKSAEGHYNEGVKYEQDNNHEEAIEAFEKAHYTCTSGYKNKSLFLECANRVKNDKASYLNSQANDHENNQRYQEASEMYNKAYETCADNCEHKVLYKRNQDRAETCW